MVAVAERHTQVQTELMRLQSSEGRLTPESVVAAARDPQSLLHAYFEWDDHAAGEQWRLAQARRLIRSVRLEITTQTIEVRAVGYVRDPTATPREQGYQGLLAVQSREDWVAETLEQEIKRAAGIIARVRSVAQALDREEEALARLRALLV
jgi:plasmid replication initiation protein